MKKTFAVFCVSLSILFCSCSISPALSEFRVEANSSQGSLPANLPASESFDAIEIIDLMSSFTDDTSTSFDQICYLEQSKELCVLTNSKSDSTIVRINMVTNEMTVTPIRNRVVRADFFDEVVFTFGKQEVIKRNIAAKTEINYKIADKKIKPMASLISFDQKNIVYFDDSNIYLTDLSYPDKVKRIPVAVNGRILLALSLKGDFYYTTLMESGKEKSSVVVNSTGEDVFRGEFDSTYPAIFKNGVLLHQGQESNVSNKLYVVDVEEKVVSEISTADKRETNAVNISHNGHWLITAVFEESSGRLTIRQYDLMQKKYYEHEIPSNWFIGTANIVGASDSLFIGDDGRIGGLRLLDDTGFKLLKFEFPSNEKVSYNFTIKAKESSLFFK